MWQFNFAGFFDILYYKVWQSNFITKCDKLLLQSASGITKCDKLLLQSASGITKCDRLLLQSASGITKCDSYYKVRRNTVLLDHLLGTSTEVNVLTGLVSFATFELVLTGLTMLLILYFFIFFHTISSTGVFTTITSVSEWINFLEIV